MGISPHDGEELIANEIRRIYSDAELRVIQKIARSVKKDKRASDWASRKLAELQKIKNDVDNEVIEQLVGSNDKVMEAVEKAYKKGQRAAEKDIADLGMELKVKGQFTKMNKRAVEQLARESVDKLNKTHIRILRETEDVYRNVIAEASGSGVAGADTRLETAQRALNKFANKGVTGFVDKSGRAWNLASYTEMATRSATGRAAINGSIDRLQENDINLGMISQHGEECDLCRPWEGKVVSLNGKHDKYPSLSQAISEGLFHPNCRHNVSAYVHNLTKTDDADPDPRGNELRRKQRYNERQIRKWKRRKAGAMTDKEQRKAKQKVREWQKKQREFLGENNRRRKYEREQIDTAR